jgi:hypothetical protein
MVIDKPNNPSLLITLTGLICTVMHGLDLGGDIIWLMAVPFFSLVVAQRFRERERAAVKIVSAVHDSTI